MAPRCMAAVLALLASAGAGASPFLMPEQTRELAVGAMLGNREEDEGSRTRSTYLQPYLEVKWSNGMFLQGLWLGRQFSSTPGLQYGPLLTVARERSAPPGRDTRLMPVFGAFGSVQLLHNLSFAAHAYRMAGSQGGAAMNLQLVGHRSLAAHHALVMAAGVRLADRRHLQAHLGAGPDARAGVKDLHAEARWDWELTPKYTASAGLDIKRLQGDAATGTLVTRRTGTGYSLMLVARY
jgi:outer membrane scaffolding protein for murein synthesis (MipA/OmpV family)